MGGLPSPSDPHRKERAFHYYGPGGWKYRDLYRGGRWLDRYEREHGFHGFRGFDFDHFGPGKIPHIFGEIIEEIGRHPPAHRFDGSRAHGEWDGCRSNGEHVFGEAFDDRCDDTGHSSPRPVHRHDTRYAHDAPDDERRGDHYRDEYGRRRYRPGKWRRPDAHSDDERYAPRAAAATGRGEYANKFEWLGAKLFGWLAQAAMWFGTIVEGVLNNLWGSSAHAAERKPEPHTPGDRPDLPAASARQATAANRLAACLGALHDGDGGKNDRAALGCIASIISNSSDPKFLEMARAINSQLDGESVVFRTSDSNISDQLQRTQYMIRDFTNDRALDRDEGQAIVNEIKQMNLPEHIVTTTRSRGR